jgi:hypothetical protein
MDKYNVYDELSSLVRSRDFCKTKLTQTSEEIERLTKFLKEKQEQLETEQKAISNLEEKIKLKSKEL